MAALRSSSSSTTFLLARSDSAISTMLTAPCTIFWRASMIASACCRRSMAPAISGAYAKWVKRASSITTPALPTRSCNSCCKAVETSSTLLRSVVSFSSP